jgi:hypothetical protein
MSLKVVSAGDGEDGRTLENVIKSQEKLQEAVELLTQTLVGFDARIAKLERETKKRPPAILNAVGERVN